MSDELKSIKDSLADVTYLSLQIKQSLVFSITWQALAYKIVITPLMRIAMFMDLKAQDP